MCFFLTLLRISSTEDKRRPVPFSLSYALVCVFGNYLPFPVPFLNSSNKICGTEF